MKKLILICALIVISLCLFACSPEVSVDVSCADFYEFQHVSKEVEVAVGDSFTVTLCSNPSTGFRDRSQSADRAQPDFAGRAVGSQYQNR